MKEDNILEYEECPRCGNLSLSECAEWSTKPSDRYVIRTKRCILKCRYVRLDEKYKNEMINKG